MFPDGQTHAKAQANLILWRMKTVGRCSTVPQGYLLHTAAVLLVVTHQQDWKEDSSAWE